MKTARLTHRTDRETRLLPLLRSAFGFSGKQAKRALDDRHVFVNRRPVWMARHRLRPGDRVDVLTPAPARAPAALRVLLDDGRLLVVDKPPGMLADGPRSVQVELRRQLLRPALRAVHRLDRETSGCLLLAADDDAFDSMLPLFRRREVGKTYEAIVAGRVRPARRTLSRPIEGQPAVTHLRVLAGGPLASHLRLRIETGRTHQIRRHLAGIGHPVVGDRQYAATGALRELAMAAPRHMLHAARLAFRSPLSDRPVRAAAPLPADFRACLKSLQLTGAGPKPLRQSR